ncbi:MAG TPA: LamG-like jellyroll fold domain-containing protein [Fimbriimonadaceae bacterium]|nr:LamG-like jellyroll fold domain-containing protein [Fimbriimonadaceae bacterium]
MLALALLIPSCLVRAQQPILGQPESILPLDGLIGYWPGYGSARDYSPVGNDGSFGGQYVMGAPGGRAFDLSTDLVTIPASPIYNLRSYPGWTVGFWFNTNGIQLGNNGFVFLGQDNGSGYRPKWFIDYGYTVYGPNSSFVWHVNDNNQERIFLQSQPVTLPTGWNQLTVVTDNIGGTVAFYLNGQSIGVDSLPNYVLQTGAPLIFGYAEPGLGYRGLLNNVVLYDRALTAYEVLRVVGASPFITPH